MASMFEQVDKAARLAYETYCQLQTSRTLPDWDKLSRTEQGLYEWIARYTWLQCCTDRATTKRQRQTGTGKRK